MIFVGVFVLGVTVILEVIKHAHLGWRCRGCTNRFGSYAERARHERIAHQYQ